MKCVTGVQYTVIEKIERYPEEIIRKSVLIMKRLLLSWKSMKGAAFDLSIILKNSLLNRWISD